MSAQPSGGPLKQHLQAAAPLQRARILNAFLREQIAERLGIDSSEIEPRGQLMSLGMSSLKAIELKLKLEEELGFGLRSSLLFDYPTLETLVPFLLDRLVLKAGNSQPAERAKRVVVVASPSHWEATNDNLLSELAHELNELNSAE
jgi:acyl carrier protein